MKKILVIDGNSIINRAFYGIRILTTKSDKYTNAIYGMVNMITKQIDAIKPDYCAVAFDIKHPTFRHEMYDGYKAGRHPTPPELLSQFPDAKECLTLMGIKVLELPGWEADDIQGTIAKMAHSENDTESYILSGDRDLLQLIDDKVTVLLATNSDTLTFRRGEFREKYGIEPELFVDMKALMGDSSDNIPGVAGVGEKTAASLIQNFGHLEEIYDNIDDKRITKGVREKLIRDEKNAYLSRDLARIDIHAPLDITLEDIKYSGFDKGGLYKKFSELELNSFITKFKLEPEMEELLSDTDLTEMPTFDRADAKDIAKIDAKRVAVEIKDGKAYISTRDFNLFFDCEIEDIAKCLEGKELVCYDGKALWHILDRAGADCSKISFLDLMMYEYVINPGSGNAGISSLLSMFVGINITRDAITTPFMLELEEKMREKIQCDGLEKILFDVELPLIGVLASTEKNGFKINPSAILEFGEALGELADSLANRIYIQAGECFNINSPKQLGTVLYEKMGLSGSKKKGKTGYSTDAQTLEEMRGESPIIDDILEYRHVTKLRSTYTTALTDAADENGRLHTEFKQAQTATGRLSSAEPNLQNIPIRTKLGREMRKFFIAEDGYTLVDADYSQIELRLLAHISDDYTMKEAFREGEDIHRKTAAAVFGIPEEFVNDEMRKRAKAVNFGIVYGISGFSLSKDIGTTVSEATKYIKNYLMNYPSIDAYLEDVVKNAEKDGFTTTIMGRRRYIPELKSSKAPLRAFGKRVAMNAPIQGSAADIMKVAMINVYKALKEAGLDAKIVMQVHDELIIEVKDSDADACKSLLKAEMEKALELSIPLTVDVTTGKNWLEQN
ncbi:MAG: DNA polymerase I [Clostridia bacterium]|nr:DNA polymerase I [Clostridia bacterium]